MNFVEVRLAGQVKRASVQFNYTRLMFNVCFLLLFDFSGDNKARFDANLTCKTHFVCLFFSNAGDKDLDKIKNRETLIFSFINFYFHLHLATKKENQIKCNIILGVENVQ